MKKYYSMTTASVIVTALLLILAAGCGRSGEGENAIPENGLTDNRGTPAISDDLSAVRELTDDVNRYVTTDYVDTTEPKNVEEVMNGFAERYSELAAKIEESDTATAEAPALSLALKGADSVAALAEALKGNPGVIDYSDPAVIAWGEYSEAVYNSLSTGSPYTDTSCRYNGGKGFGRNDSSARGYGWRDEDYASDGRRRMDSNTCRFRDRDRERLRDGSCGDTPRSDGSGRGQCKGSGMHGGFGYGRGNGSGNGNNSR